MENQYEYAKANGHTNSAIKALELLSRVRGANSDTISSLDEETLETSIIGCLNVLGEEKVYDLLTKCNFYERENKDEDDDEGTDGTYELPFEGDSDAGEEDTAA